MIETIVAGVQTRSYPCGCINYIDPIWNVMRSHSKCSFHTAHGGKGGLAHYIEMGAIHNGFPQHQKYGQEMVAALAEMGCEPLHNVRRCRTPLYALEIGAGLGMYAPLMMNLGYRYSAIEPDTEAAVWLRGTFDVPVHIGTLETIKTIGDYHKIIAAHVLEHVLDAPKALTRILSLLAPGCQLIGIVPDDRDPVNPDHLWFFTEPALKRMLETIGFGQVQTLKKSVVAHEDFIYFSARKPLFGV